MFYSHNSLGNCSLFFYLSKAVLEGKLKGAHCSETVKSRVSSTGHLIGCDKKSEIVQYFQGGLCDKIGLLCDKLCDFFQGQFTLFYQVSKEKNHFNVAIGMQKNNETSILKQNNICLIILTRKRIKERLSSTCGYVV